MISNFTLIVGAMKCGTTSLFSYLAQHPQVAGCRKKEPNFFADDRNWAKGFEWYQSLWDWNPLAHTVALEASTHYTKIPRFPNAAARIATIKNADFRFIYIMRHPIDRIQSHYLHGYAMGWPTVKQPIIEGIDPQIIEVSKYARQIEEYYKRFSRDKILLLMFEDLKEDPLKVIESICHFLEIDSSFTFKIDKIHNSSNGRRKQHPYWRSIKRLELSRFIVQFVPAHFKRLSYNLISTDMPREKIELSEGQLNSILAELQSDLRKLSLEYGVDVSRWGIQF